MKKRIIALAATLASPLLAAENATVDTGAPHALEHVIVSMPAHKKDARTAMPVSRIDGEDLRNRAATTLGDTLKQMPGLASASFGPAVGQPVIRGQQGPRVLVLENGLPSLDVSTNSADHAVSVEPVLAEAIEVLRGPSTLLYGGGAIGGIVNVLDGRIPTKAVDRLDAAVETRFSSVDDGRTSVMRVDGGDGRWAVHLDSLYRDWAEPDIPGLAINPANVDEIENNSRGYIENADGRTRRFSLGAAYHFDSAYWGISYSELRNNYGIPAGVHHHEHEEDHDAHDEEHEDHDEHEGHEDHEEEAGIRLEVEQKRWEMAGDWHRDGLWELLRWRVADSEYQHVELEPGGEEGTRFQRQASTARFELSHRSMGNWHGVVGLQFLDSDFSALGEEAFVPATQNRNLGLFWLEDFHGKDWQLELGVRAEYDSLEVERAEGLGEENGWLLSASLGALYDINAHWGLSFSLSESRRAATAEERYSNVFNSGEELVLHGATGVIEVGDISLSREKSRNLDVGLQMDYGHWSGEIRTFFNSFDDFIYLDNGGEVIEDASVVRYRQQGADFYGLEYEFRYRLWQGEAAQLSASLYGDRVRGELGSGGDIPRLPPARDGLRLNWQRTQWAAELDWQRGHKQARPGPFEAKTAAYDRLDAQLSWFFEGQQHRYSLSLRGSNLLDEEIRNSTSFIRDYAPEPGRSITVSMRVDLGMR